MVNFDSLVTKADVCEDRSRTNFDFRTFFKKGFCRNHLTLQSFQYD